ncbi:alpha/beta hydrolase [Azonexus hydrophilus]|nr:alpha/beta fold hydrolase [Azonexus hydrophilus]
MNRLFQLFRRLAGICLIVMSTGASADDAARQRAIELLDYLDAGRYSEATAMFTPRLVEALPAGRLHVFWASLPALYGQPLRRGRPVDEEFLSGYKVRIGLEFEQAMLVAEITINSQQQIGSFMLLPDDSPAPLVKNARFAETAFDVPLQRGSLPATLTRPNGPGPFPGVVLVHGSGPHDRDESIGPNRPFRDLAHGLAARGIAVLRYEKRSRVRPGDYAGDFSVDDETTDDAVAALQLLAGTPGIGPVFIFGHSQGGMLAPRIARRAGIAAGAILWAAPARPVGSALIEQLGRIAAMDGNTSADEQKTIDQIAQGLARIRQGDNPPRAEAPLQLPATYWRSLDDILAVDEAKQAKIPLLILHGGRDYQVTDTDWQTWRDAFADDPRATLKRYSALNHLGIAGSGRSTPDEYLSSGQVDAGLIEDSASWIMKIVAERK